MRKSALARLEAAEKKHERHQAAPASTDERIAELDDLKARGRWVGCPSCGHPTDLRDER